MGIFVGYFKDPIFEDKGEWFFWDKDWAVKIGPFESEATARIGMDRYIASFYDEASRT